jgi:hypothetical protein
MLLESGDYLRVARLFRQLACGLAVRVADAGLGGCHASDFERHEHENKQTGLQYTVGELKDCTTSCHVEDDGRPEHRVGASEW